MSADRHIEKFSLGDARAGYRGTLHVGLVNNMPDTAMRATELQFAQILKEASGALDVRLHLFSFRQIARGELARSRMEGFYADADTLPTAGIDALIVTGAEPTTGDMRHAPYWDALAHLVDWAEIGTVSTLFSCLAAHAAVLHLDGIVRQKLPRKLSGVFAAERVNDDPLLMGMAGLVRVPHSRRHGLSESELSGHGYRILSRIPQGGVDGFARLMPGRSLFLFQQGHPEYGAQTLGREYVRDVGRFLRGDSAERPAVPSNYFDRITEYALADLDAVATSPDDLARYNAIVSETKVLHSWRDQTLKLFANWLTLAAAEKMRRAGRAHAPARGKLRA
jgi:homoserine O-succinyltransferase